MSTGKALIKGMPVVFTCSDGRLPNVVCEPGKEKEALELLERMSIITLSRPVRDNSHGVPIEP